MEGLGGESCEVRGVAELTFLAICTWCSVLRTAISFWCSYPSHTNTSDSTLGKLLLFKINCTNSHHW